MHFDITHEGRTTLSVDRDSALALGYSLEAVDEAERNVRIDLVKLECRRRIYAEASAETQMNMATAAAVISAKEASARTEDEASILSGLDDAIGWVAQMRARVTELADDVALDIGDDANWPPLPDGARDVVAKF
tara:strand:+ start:9459 stop:9860 length:402 start_codon:yes stop_codon:yes gene_type:complete